MKRSWCALAVAVGLLLGLSTVALAQKRGGVLTVWLPDSPGGLSIHEEATVMSMGPMAGVFDNLIVFDQHVKQSSLDTILPDLATQWSWSGDGLALTFQLRHGVKFHDGQPFTAQDVLCTWALLLETSADKLRVNPRKALHRNVETVTANGDFEVTFHLKQPQPAYPMVLASVAGAIYPCHVKPAQMRTQPIGTGPFAFVAFKPNEYIEVKRNADYWRPDRPYLDGIEYRIVKDPGTAMLAFVAGKFDLTMPHQLSIANTRNIQSQAPWANCEITAGGGINRHLLINRTTPPFDNPEIRRAMALSIDRKAFVEIAAEGEGDIGGVLQPPPGGKWGMSAEMLKDLPGYDPDVAKNREEARAIMRKLGYGPENRLKFKVLTRDSSFYKTPAVLLIDQLKEVYFDGELDSVETPAFFPRVYRHDFTIGLNLQTSGPDPGMVFEQFYRCGSTLNWDGYCDRDVDRLIEQHAMTADQDRLKQMGWELERKLAADLARPILFYTRVGTCWKPAVKNLTVMEDSIFNDNRRDEVWLDR